MIAHDLVEGVLHRAVELVGQRQPRIEQDEDVDGRYVARSGSSWSVEELRALARECLADEPED